MKIITEQEQVQILSILQGIGTDRDSWTGWLCLRVELPRKLSDRERRRIRAGCVALIETALSEREGTAFVGEQDEILVFCRSATEILLRELGQQSLDLIIAASGRGANYMVFDVHRDAEHMTSLHSWKDVCEVSSQTERSGFLKPFLEETSALVLPDAIGTAERTLPPDTRKVLLVEDDPVTRWMVRTALKDECFLATAQDAGRALAVYKTYRPDMVLLDINLPDRSGRDLMSGIMRTDPGAYIVMFSSDASVETISGALDGGARGFIAKPFSRDRILRYLRASPSTR